MPDLAEFEPSGTQSPGRRESIALAEYYTGPSFTRMAKSAPSPALLRASNGFNFVTEDGDRCPHV